MLATLATSRTRLAGRGSGAAAALTGGYHLAFTVAAVLAPVGALVAATVLRGAREARSSDEVGAAELQTT